MPKKRRRRRQRSRGAQRTGVTQAPAHPPQPPGGRAEAAPGVSWLGLIGGLLGFAPMTALAAEILIDPPEVGRPFAAVPLVMAAIYVPAIWASVSPAGRRQAILRGSLTASLVLAFAGSVLFGPVLLIVLLPATALLAIAGRLIFSR